MLMKLVQVQYFIKNSFKIRFYVDLLIFYIILIYIILNKI